MNESSFESARPDPSRARRLRNPAKKTRAEKEPPHSPEAEQGVVGCVLLSPSECLDECNEARLSPEWFYDLRHTTIYEHALKLQLEGKPWDVIVLQQRLKDAGLLEEIGGISYLASLPDAVPSTANLSYYLDIVREKWQLRTMLQMCSGVIDSVSEFEGHVDELFTTIHSQFLQIQEAASRPSESTIRDVLKNRVLPKMEAHYTRGRAQITGVTTGLEYLDKIFSGLGGGNGNYYVLAARPNVGKTSLISQIAMHVSQDYRFLKEVPAEEAENRKAKGEQIITIDDGKQLAWHQGLPVGISSMEMQTDSLVQKMLFQRSGADLQRWRTGFAYEGDLTIIGKAASELGASNRIIIDDSPRLRIGQLKARWRRWYRQYGVRFFILDYLQLMQADQKKFRNDRVQELEEVSAEIQALGKELNCPLMILAQMNRDYEKDPFRAPRMSDLKNCGAVEQDADAITFLYEPKLSDTAREFFENAMHAKFGENWKKWDAKPQRINALVAKNRLGPKGKAELLLLHSSTTFVDWNVWLKENKLKAAAMGESKYNNDEEPTNH